MVYPDPVKVPKLVRDNMPLIWKEHGDKVQWHILRGEDLKRALRQKLLEESQEVVEAGMASSVAAHDEKGREALLGEYADLFQVLMASVQEDGFSLDQLIERAEKQEADRGGFEKGVYLTAFEWGPGRVKPQTTPVPVIGENQHVP